MNEAKQEILNRLGEALHKEPGKQAISNEDILRNYRQKGQLSDRERIDLFAERVGEYKAEVSRVKREKLTNQIAQSCQKQQVEKLVAPPDFPEKWQPSNVNVVQDDGAELLSHYELDSSDGVITCCTLAVAQTGTIILDGGEAQGRRALTLLPDYHLCIVEERQVVEILPEAITHFSEKIEEKGPPLTFISGPSATSDIELSRVEGVHGPRHLEVLIVED